MSWHRHRCFLWESVASKLHNMLLPPTLLLYTWAGGMERVCCLKLARGTGSATLSDGCPPGTRWWWAVASSGPSASLGTLSFATGGSCHAITYATATPFPCRAVAGPIISAAAWTRCQPAGARSRASAPGAAAPPVPSTAVTRQRKYQRDKSSNRPT